MQFVVALPLGLGHTEYWFAGTLTILASVIVVVVILTTSRHGDGDSSQR